MDISEQVKELRKLEKQYQDSRFLITSRALREAADTIESLSAKLQAVNMERPANFENCGNCCLNWDLIHGGCTIHNTVPVGCKDFYPVKKSNNSADCGGWIPCSSGKMPDGGQAVLIRLKNGCGGIDGINDTDNSPYDISFVRVEDNNKWVSSCGTYPLKDVIAWKEIESYKP